ncbi:MAG: hypothetical protein WCO45_04220 [Pseudanabaena sp. ELA607]|jgi:hypothetical protein
MLNNPLYNKTTKRDSKDMKVLNVLGATALAASTLSLFVAPEAKASDVFARNGQYGFTGAWQFDFNSSYGGYTSGFGIGPATSPANAPTVIEANGNVPGSCTSCSTTYNFAATGVTQFFLDSAGGPSRMFSGANSSYIKTQPALGNDNGFLVLTASNYAADSTVGGSYVKSSSDPLYGGKLNLIATAYFANPAHSSHVIVAVNDQFSGDSDYQDMILTGKAVPVPALVPGLALAAAFLGYRSKRQNKTNKA